MSIRTKRRFLGGRRTGAALMAVALSSAGLVTATSSVSGASPVDTTVNMSCAGADAESRNLLNTAAGILGSNRVPVNLRITGGDVPANAGLDQAINGNFNWTASMGQDLIDAAAGLVSKLDVTNIVVQQLVRGPAGPNEFGAVVPGPISIVPKAGVAASLPIGAVGGEVTTNGGGIVTFRVGTVTLSAALTAAGADLPTLNLTCSPQGSNLIARTTVRDPDAPVVNPEVVTLEATGGQTVTKDLLGEVISEGKTPLQPETLKIVEPPTAGEAKIENGVFSFTAPNEPGTYSTTYEVCGEPKADGGIPGVNEVQELILGTNWQDGVLGPRPVAFSLKAGEEETPLIWTAEAAVFPLLNPMPLGGTMPTPENWAPANKEGLVNRYAGPPFALPGAVYKAPKAATIKAALEALPNVGPGNVEVEEVKGNAKSPNKVTGFKITYVGAKAEQDMPDIALGQWYSVLPTEILDGLTGLLSSIGGDDEEGGEEAPPAKTVDEALAAIQNAIENGQPITDQMWDDLGAAITGGILEEVMAAVPEILNFLNEIFPQKAEGAVLEQGESPTPPQPLCAQGIVDVTVSVVEVEAEPPVVGGTQQVPPGLEGTPVGLVG